MTGTAEPRPVVGRGHTVRVGACHLALALAFAGRLSAAQATLEPLPASSTWPDASAPGALRMACARSEEDLASFFAREGVPFRPALLRREGSRVCHVFFRPSVPGYRAAPEDDPVTGLVFDTDPLAYLAAATGHPFGPAGAVSEVLRRVARPLDVSVLLHFPHEAALYEDATRRLLGGTPHRVRLVDRGLPRTFWWVQDILKAGTAAGRPRRLLPWRVFEQDPETGASATPMLDRLASQEGAARSRLSWEGGDLLLARDPSDPRRLVLYHGRAARSYWAEALTDGEYEHVLAREMGADEAVDLGGLAPHVDYVVSLLAPARVALVAVPVSGDLAAARAAVAALAARFAAGRVPDALLRLGEALSAARADPRAVRDALARARGEQAGWQLAADPALAERMRALVARACPGGTDCLAPAVQQRLLAADRDTFGAWVRATQAARAEPAVIAAHLDLVESQLDPVPEPIARRVEERIAALERRGLRVVRVPAFRVDLVRPRGWPGISYVNALVVDRQVFVPRFGLGEVEDRILRGVSAGLPDGYELVAIDAQDVLIRNGGLHCLAALVR